MPSRRETSSGAVCSMSFELRQALPKTAALCNNFSGNVNKIEYTMTVVACPTACPYLKIKREE